jgi:hypothetical protein
MKEALYIATIGTCFDLFVGGTVDNNSVRIHTGSSSNFYFFGAGWGFEP